MNAKELNDHRLIETACWRIWHRLDVRGELTEKDLMANCGVGSEIFEEAITALVDIGTVEETEDGLYRAVENPRMMQVFPTLHNSEL